MLKPEHIRWIVEDKGPGWFKKIVAAPSLLRARVCFDPGFNDAHVKFAKEEVFRIIWHALYGEIISAHEALCRAHDDRLMHDHTFNIARFDHEATLLRDLGELLRLDNL